MIFKTITRKKRILRFIAVFVTINFISTTILSPFAYALTSGPSSPEFSSFEPVATTDMVNLFSGDFNYNLPMIEIPGPDGGGYALSLSYHSGASSEEEASWVGYGWTLNPGAINRNTRGFPDDYSSTEITRYNKTRTNWSASLTNDLGLEIFAKKTAKTKDKAGKDSSFKYNKSIVGINAGSCLRFNNYQGFSRYYTLGLSAAGLANLNMTVGAQGPTFSAGINVPALLGKLKKKADTPKTGEEGVKAKKELTKLQRYLKDKYSAKSLGGGVLSAFGSTHGIYTFNQETRATTMSKYKGANFGWNTGVTVNPAPIPVGFNIATRGSLNYQKTEEASTYSANGYMNYKGGGLGVMNDYFVEKGNPYSRRDVFLGIPFNNADVFSVVGEGLSGGFRFIPKKVRNYYPDFVSNQILEGALGFDLHLGTGVGFGISIGLGMQKSLVKNWDAKGNTEDYQNFSTTENGIFRFANDMAGKVEYGDNNIPYTNTSLFGGPWVDENIVKTGINNDRLSNSSYIDYHSYNDISTKKFNKKLTIDPALNLSTSTSSIVELSVHNSDGVNYIYGEPVFARNDVNAQVDVRKTDAVDIYNYLAYKDDGLDASFKINTGKHITAVGESRNIANANTYLLTQIYSPDYVDVGDDGPDNKDFGGWTSFDYYKQYGNNSWYKWRNPYVGLNYDRNQISDDKDNMGAFSTGEKEVKYLKNIETKTHIAFFVTNMTKSVGSSTDRFKDQIEALVDGQQFTKEEDRTKLRQYLQNILKGSGIQRKDGMDAGDSDGLKKKPTATSCKPVEHLERILLFSKERPDKPLKIVNLSYDYSLVQNLPNNKDGNYGNGSNTKTNSASGKLTLKKVWFEYEGVFKAKISPYEFKYEYKNRNEIAQNVKDDYPEIMGERNATNLSTSYPEYNINNQNPDYNPYLLDPWGNIQVFGKERKKYMIPWVYQGQDVGNLTSDEVNIPSNWRQK